MHDGAKESIHLHALAREIFLKTVRSALGALARRTELAYDRKELLLVLRPVVPRNTKERKSVGGVLGREWQGVRWANAVDIDVQEHRFATLIDDPVERELCDASEP